MTKLNLYECTYIVGCWDDSDAQSGGQQVRQYKDYKYCLSKGPKSAATKIRKLTGYEDIDVKLVFEALEIDDKDINSLINIRIQEEASRKEIKRLRKKYYDVGEKTFKALLNI